MTEVTIQKGPLAEATAETVADFVFEDGLRPLGLGGSANGRGIIEAMKRDSFRGQVGDLFVWHPPAESAVQRFLIAGLGRRRDYRVENLRRACRTIGRKMSEIPTRGLALPMVASLHPGRNAPEVVRAEVENVLLGNHRFTKYLTNASVRHRVLPRLAIHTGGGISKSLQAGLHLGRVAAMAANLARDLVSEPAGFLNPSRMVSIARNLARGRKLACEVLGPAQLRRLKMGGLLGVAQGSSEPPYLILLRYRPAKKAKRRVAIIGKGLTFDSGGLSLKNAESMETMKSDMAGAASVLAVMNALPELKPQVEVLGVLAMAENMPGGNAIRPGDVLKMHSGLTVEVRNTDAEGRLVLADALSYVGGQDVDEVLDLATLTGACVVALGPLASGVMGNDQKLIDRVLRSADRCGEMMWQLPLYDEYYEQLRSDVADIRNTGSRWGGAITAGLFLKRFVKPGLPWAHLDIAGPAFLDDEASGYPKGATGTGVRTLLSFLSPGER